MESLTSILCFAAFVQMISSIHRDSRQIIDSPPRNPCPSGYIVDNSGKCRRVFMSGMQITASGGDQIANNNNSNQNSATQNLPNTSVSMSVPSFNNQDQYKMMAKLYELQEMNGVQ